MKEKFGFIVLLLISITCFSQNAYKETYYYFQNEEITKAKFESFDERKTYKRVVENDSSTTKHIYFHKNVGKLDSIQFNQIQMLLTKIIGPEFKQNKKTILHIYRKGNNHIYADSKYKSYWNWIKNNSNEYQAFLIGSKDSDIKVDKKRHIFVDQYDLLETLFFKNSEFNINHLLIKPTSEIYIYSGIDDILNVLDWSVD